MIPDIIKKAAETVRRLDTVRRRMAKAAYLKKKRVASHLQSRIKERKAAERLIERALQPFFADQIESASKALMSMADTGTKEAGQPFPSIFNPADWDKKLIDTLYPAMVKIAVVGMDGEMRRMGLQIKQAYASTKVFCPTGPGGGVDATCSRGGNTGEGFEFDEAGEWKFGSGKVPARKLGGVVDTPFPRDDEYFKRRKPTHYNAVPDKDQVSLNVKDLFSWQAVVDPEKLRPIKNIDELPPIKVVKLDGKYIIDDGNHRAVSAFVQGIESIKAIVTDFDKKENQKYLKPKKDTFSGAKSTATDLIHDLVDTGGLLDINVLETPYGPVNMAFLFEYPDWMKEAIAEFLKETFSQSYWEEVNKTTYGDIQKYLQDGIREGWSVERMATEMAPQLMQTGRYAKIRGRNIARTEAGHALNGARSMGIDSVIAELAGTGLDIKKLWHSVRGTTTREDHKDIHGVPADKEGTWTLAGHKCRWPGDVSLPANQRCNCQCTIESAFGMTDDEARDLIRAYEKRIAKASWADLRTKVFCPTGPGGGVDATCSPGGATKIPAIPPLSGAAGVALGPKYKALYDAASTGDTAAVRAVKTNPEASSPYPKKLHEYKMAVLAAMEAGKSLGPAPTPAPAPSIDMKKVGDSSPPVKEALKQGDIVAAVEAAKDDDIEAIKQAAEQIEAPPKPTTEDAVLAKAEKAAKSADKKKTAAKINSIEELDTFIPLPATPPAKEKQMEKEWKDLMKQHDEAVTQRHKNSVWSAMKQVVAGKMSIDDYKELGFRESEAQLKEDAIERRASVLSNIRHAADPDAYEKATKPLIDEYDSIVSEEIAYVKKAMAKITPTLFKEYGSTEVASFTLSRLRDIKMKGTEDTDKGWSGSSEKNYTGITAEMINTFRKFESRRMEIRKKLEDGEIPAIYYGENKQVRNLPSQGMGGETKVPPKTKVGDGSSAGEFVNFLGQAEVCIQTRSQAIDKILSSGAMKNGFQGGTKGVGLGKSGYKSTRKEVENKIFGLDDDTPAADRPIYGYLEHPDRSKSRGSDIGGNYGSVQLVLKPEVKSKTTFTFGDSLDDGIFHGGQAGSVANPPKLKEVVANKIEVNSVDGGLVSHNHQLQYTTDQPRSMSYIEAQIHGGVSLSDIKEVRIEKGVQLSPKSLANLQSQGVIVREIPPPLRYYIGHSKETLTHTGVANDNEFWESQKK